MIVSTTTPNHHLFPGRLVLFRFHVDSRLISPRRYTRWHRWNGSALAADWTPSGFLAEELYNHTGDNGSDFDAFPIGHANLADTGGAATTELQALRKVAEDFFRWRNYSQ